MTEEEAIKRLKNKLENDIEYANRCNPFSDLVHEVILDNKAVERVLNLIEKRDNKIKELEKEVGEKDKVIRKMAERVYLKKEEYECVRENQKRNMHKSFEDCIIEYFEKKEV